MHSFFVRERSSRRWGRLPRWCVGLASLLLALWLGPSLAHASPARDADWRVAPKPAWVEATPGPLDPNFASAHPERGVAYEVLEDQHRIVDGEDWAYARTVLRIVSEAGTEAAGQQSFEFSPPNERLVLHSIRIHRGEETLDRLEAADVQLLQREANLEQLVYNNRRTAFILIPDLRVGDVLEYDWSIIGSNPAFDGHAAVGIATNRSVAVGVTSARVLVDRELNTSAFGGAAAPTLESNGPFYEYTMRSDSVPAAPLEGNVPAEEQSIAWVQFTDFDNWEAVARWGIALFEPLAKTDPSIDEVLKNLGVENAPKDAQVLAVLHWVQAEVRYFSYPFSESTHRPTAPATVLERRYGDCKDMALLMVVMLRELGVDAQIALVDADGGRFLPQMLPSIFAFDHAVVVAFPFGNPVWLDPTASHQAGSLDDVAARGLHWALPLASDVRRLVRVQEPPRRSPGLVVQADYTSTAFDTPATLKLTARYAGAWADSFRYLRDTLDAEAFDGAFEEAIEQDLRSLHPKAESTGPLQYTDLRDENTIVLRREYRIPDLWAREEGRIQAAIAPFTLYDTATTAEPDRTQPLGLPYPQHRRHLSTLTLPQDFPIEPEEVRIDEGPLSFTFSAQRSGPVVELQWSFEHTHHRVEVSELKAYSTALDEVNERMQYWVWAADPDADTAGTFNWLIFLAGSMWVLILCAGCLWVIKRAPYMRRDHVRYDPSLVGLGGWLALVGFGLILSLPRIAKDAYELLPSYSNEAWAAVTAADAVDYDPLWAPVLLFELFANLLMIVLGALATYLYFKRHRSFPLILIVSHIVSAVALTADAALTGMLLDDEVSIPELLGDWVRTTVWVLYAIHSVRVRSTFLPPPADAQAGGDISSLFPSGRKPAPTLEHVELNDPRDVQGED